MSYAKKALGLAIRADRVEEFVSHLKNFIEVTKTDLLSTQDSTSIEDSLHLQIRRRKLPENSSPIRQKEFKPAKKKPKNKSKPGKENYHRATSTQRRNCHNFKPGEEGYHRTTPTLAKKLPENNSKPSKGGYHRTTPNPTKKLIGMNLNSSRKLSENSSKTPKNLPKNISNPDEKNYSKSGEGSYQKTAPNSAKKPL
ncbi:hypothetical protein C2G38_2041722 [Gigaspora rosea]|uniref:Uncharacterized protein n=1 Tax=Gigaspora rosea TaxID=44941 RepID=A0A397UQH5_9GLOM|nr:hypothetical protein C2G38_2041722 [Gigaspora rosea]